MKYRLSPINIFVGLSTILLLISPFLTDADTGELLALFYLIPIFIFGLLIDFVIQLFSKNHRWTIIIELVIIILVLMLNFSLK